MQWTKEQQSAIDTRECDLLVAAAAGSGKTAVLVERIIKMITRPQNPIDVDRLLVVTFTNAAAAEMKERLGASISKKLEEDPRNIHLQKQLTLLNRASISTIHSFCLDVIKNNFHLLDLDPSFRIADDTEILLLKTDLLETIFEEFYEKGREDFHSLVECYGGKKQDTKLQEIVLRIHSFIQSNPWPSLWLKEKVEVFDPTKFKDFNETSWAKIIKEQVKVEALGLLEISKNALNLSKEANAPDKYIQVIEDDVNILKKLISFCEEDIESLYTYISQISFLRQKIWKDGDEYIKKEIGELRDLVKKGVNKLKENIFFKSPGEMLKDMHRTFPVMKALKEVLDEFSIRFQDLKKEKGIIDFNDIEHYCLDILLDKGSTPGKIIPSPVALELKEKYEEILVDEYQDSNLVQETILEVISRKNTSNPNRFMVGDVKQSIYRFRLAKPDLFIKKYNTFSTKEDGKERRIDLFQNFRSRENILNGINFIFRQIMTPNLGEIEYDEKAALNPGANYPEALGLNVGGDIELHIIETEDNTEETKENLQEELEEITNIELEAKIVTKKIKELMNDKNPFWVYDKKIEKYRRVNYRDIVILLRTTSKWANIFVDELSKEGIPVYADVATGYFDAIEVKIILSLLKIIDNPRQDIPLITVLRSPIVSLNSDELVEIRAAFPQGDFYESIKKYIEGTLEDTKLKLKLIKFLDNLSNWRKQAVHISIDELLWMLYTETNYYNYLGAMPGGAQRQANLRVLRDRAARYEATSLKGLFNFIRFMEKIQKNQGDMGAAKIVGENENIIRIMSIHKSKGLEFPIVFVSGLGKQFNLKDLHESILLHQDLGLGPDFVDYKKRISYDTAPKIAIREKIRLETLSEEMRILYVALTRAKEKLILTGTVKNIEDSSKKWVREVGSKKEELSPYILISAKTYMDWIGLALARHRDGEEIRKWGKCIKNPINTLYDDSSNWRVYKWGKKDINIKDEKELKEKEKILEELLNWDTNKSYSPYKEKIFNKLSWEYPYKESTALSVMISVSEIKRQYENELDQQSISLIEESQLTRPNFIEEKKGLTGAEKGIIMHFVMKHLDFNRMGNYEDIENQLITMENRGLITEEERKSVSIKKLFYFGKSELANRIRKSPKIKKEVSFILSLKAKEIYDEIQSDEDIFIRGIIDCYFEEEDGIVLVDYKTDAILDKENPDREIKKIMDKYRIQIQLYSRAIEEITGKKVKEKGLYLFSISRAVFY
ncbi:helicase-exonuclease AddAB subunit AddA [Defluviitalea phaphyphila]|uniref:helicase-exonuclease AddAB subunit AddA n=1 Tax=Defluviitalea phaphyphila TaxID=1473580 RepID=UPI000731DE2F|nr:helicase-exonuclease AddAB subunit AddA [Defluviitalea phaphyphila]